MTTLRNQPPFLAGGGEMGARIRAHNWASTPLGLPETWPQTLRSALSICLNSSFPTAIYWGPDLRLLYNDAWMPIPAENHPWALGRPAREVWADIWEVIEPQFAQVVTQARGFSTFDQMLPMRRGGVVRETYWNYSFTPLLDDAGGVAGVFNQGHETTAHILARRDSEAQIERLRDMFERAPGAIALLAGPTHIFEVTNAAYRELIGRDAVVGKTVAEALPEVVDQGFIALLDRVYSNAERYIGHNVAVKLWRPDQILEERVLDFIYEPIRNSAGAVTGIFVEATDVTERARAEEALQALNATLEQRVVAEVTRRVHAEQTLRQIQKMEAIGQLTGGIAHDFNNMLAVVIGGLNLLRRRLERGDTDVDAYINGAMEGAQRAAALTQRLLAFARQQPLEPVPIDVNRMVADMTALLERTLGEDIQIDTVLAQDLWPVRADRNELENVLLNLAVNARDAMKNGGRLTIETANVVIHQNQAQLLNVAPGSCIAITVTDTGCGMSSDIVARAFDPFFTTKPVGAGTGLGLSQVLGFVTQSGGQVRIESEVGRGTTMHVLLPRFVGAAPPASARPEDVPVHAGTAEEIVLVVEDEPRVRTFSAEALRDLGYSVVSAANGSEALQLIEKGQQVSLLFTDVVMPDMTGIQLAELALHRLPHLKVVFTTGYSRDTVVQDKVLDGGAAFLAKPFSIEQLAAKIRSALDDQ